MVPNALMFESDLWRGTGAHLDVLDTAHQDRARADRSLVECIADGGVSDRHRPGPDRMHLPEVEGARLGDVRWNRLIIMNVADEVLAAGGPKRVDQSERGGL